MKKLIVLSLAAMTLCIVHSIEAQPPGGGPPGRGPQSGNFDPAVAVEKMLTRDANGDRILTNEEVNDPRLENLLMRADKNTDGKITVEELTAVFAAEAAQPRGNRGGPNGGFGGPPFNGPGGQGGPSGGAGRGMRRPGEILPPFLQDELSLSDAQRSEIAALQADVDIRLKKILTEEQMQQLAQRPGPPPGGGPGGGERPQGAGGNAGRRPPE